MTMFNSYPRKYRNVLRHCINGFEELNSRTQTKVLISRIPPSFSIDLNPPNLPLPGNRTIWPHVAAAEVAWQLLGTQDPAFIMERAPRVWGKFIEDGKLKAAYGYRWSEAFGRNQLTQAIEALRADPTNRQVYISSWDPRTDGLGQPNQPKNIPCPVGFTMNLIDGHLNISLLIRSSDAYVGLPYDVLGYALLADAVAATLGAQRGYFAVSLAHAHIYEPHWVDVNTDFSSSLRAVALKVQSVPYPGWTIEQIIEDPHGYVDKVKETKIINFRDPRPEVIE